MTVTTTPSTIRGPGAFTAEPELFSALEALYRAIRQRDPRQMVDACAQSDHLTLWGSDAREELVGLDQLDTLYSDTIWLGACPAWISFAAERRVIGGSGDTAWVADDVRATFPCEEHSVDTLRMRCTSVWERQDSAWRLAHLHASEPRR